MLTEKKKIQIISRANSLGFEMTQVTRQQNSEIILSLEETYPQKNYAGKNKWVNRLFQDNLFEWQRDLDNMDVLEALSDVEDISCMDKDLFKECQINRNYSYNRALRIQYRQKQVLVDDERMEAVFKMIKNGERKNVVEANAFIMSNGASPQKHENALWAAQMLFDERVSDIERYADATDPRIMQIIEICTTPGVSADVSKTEFEDPDETLRLLDEAKRVYQEKELEFPRLLNIWLEKGSNDDLKKLTRNIDTTDADASSKRDYVNIITGHRFENLQLSPEFMIDIISGKKNGFLKKLIHLKENYPEIDRNINLSILNMGSVQSMLNLNELSEKDIVAFSKDVYIYAMRDSERIHMMEMYVKQMTPRVFQILYNRNQTSDYMVKVFGQLNLSADENLIRMQELPFDVTSLSNVEIEQLSKKLREKRLSKWKLEFSYIKNITKRDIVKILANYEIFEPLLSEIDTVDDIYFVLKNPDLKGDMKTRRDKYLNQEDNAKMLQEIGVAPSMAESFAKEGSLEICKAYYNGSGEKQRNNLLKIAKAAILGKLDILKYDRLEDEIGMYASKEDQELWKKNKVIDRGDYLISEYDDFKSIMQIGEKPTYTCQSYKDGSYNESLLSNFDANKKIIYVTKNGEYLARAILRITKASKERESSSLQFMDVDAENNAKNETGTHLCLFLEKAYIKKNISEKESERLKKMMQSLAKDKADEMGIPLYSSRVYEGALETRYIYISKSKNGNQYLDSLGGSVSTRNETAYHKTEIMV